MEDYEIIVNNDFKVVYCHIKYIDRIYMAVADQINSRYVPGDPFPLYDIFPIQLIYGCYSDNDTIVAEYAFIYDRIHGNMILKNINTYQFAIDRIAHKEGSYIELDENIIRKELALEMYNKFREVFGYK